MNLKAVIRTTSILLFVLSLFFLIPFFYGLVFEHKVFVSFLKPLILSLSFLALGLQLKGEPEIKEAILSVVLVWLLFPLLSSIPYLDMGAVKSLADAYFESMSGFTTTGASVIPKPEELDKSLLLWRSTTHWIGGIGFVVFSLSVMPGIGGVKLVRFESSKVVEEKLLPRVREIARAMLFVYLGLTISEILLLKLAGMSFFDAVNHTFATVATGGFSTKSQSIGYFNSPAIELIVTAFMYFGAFNFMSVYKAISSRKPLEILKHTENKALLVFGAISTIIATLILYVSHTYGSIVESLRYAVFQIATVITTTGFSSVDYSNWPSAILIMMMLLPLLGASSGSTGGGIKQFRLVMMLENIVYELKRMSHPRLVYKISVGGRVFDISFVKTTWAFVSAYFFTAGIVAFVVAIAGYDILTSVSASIACITSLGPGLAKVGPAGNYQFFPDWIKFLLSFEMLAGRLEVLTVFTVLSPFFWKE
jgi:trk system potassium uptake protein TrkH